MIRVCTILAFLPCIHLGTTLADDHIPLRMITSERAITGTDSDSEDQPLFDFPISQALGVNLRAFATPPIPRPSIHELATEADGSENIKAAEAPIVYYDAPPSYHRTRSIWR